MVKESVSLCVVVCIVLEITVAMVVFSVEIHGGRSKLPKV